MADRGSRRDSAKRAADSAKRAADSAALGAVERAMADGGVDLPGLLRIADELPVMVALLDEDLRYVFVNQAVVDFHELPRRQIIGRPLAELLGEEAFGQRRGALEQALAGHRQRLLGSYDHPSRGRLTNLIEYVPHQRADGTHGGLVAIIQDVTEQRAAEQAMRESEERFRRIADSVPKPMWVTRADGSREFVNEAFAEFLGLPREQARQADWRDYIHPDDREQTVAELAAREQGRVAFETLTRARRADGEWRWLQLRARPRIDADDECIGFIGVATDVTLAKEAELELRRLVAERTAELTASEQRFRAIFDTVLEVIVLLKPDGTVIQTNRTMAAWRSDLGWASVGRPLWEAPAIQLYPQHKELLRQALATAASGETFSREVPLEREGVPPIYFDVSIQPVRDQSGAITYLLFEARDITELKAAQEQLRQSQKMEALGQLTGGIAHDFNNLLTVVVGGLDLIVKRSSDERIARYAQNALAAAERGARLTAQLLAFSRVQRLEVRPVMVEPLISGMGELLRNVLGPSIACRFELRDQPSPVMADPTQLELALLNLAINARDAMPRGGTLIISTTTVGIEADGELSRGDYLQLAVSDSGEGMTPEVLARAFEPFFTTKDVGKGTGLGLSMVYGVARQSGGTVRIDSTPGSGTSVKLYFRLAESSAVEGDATGAAAQHSTGRGAGSVLVVDDDPDVRSFISASLGELGYQVREAGDGETGLRLAAEQRPDLVILDFVMPGMSGAEAASRLLEQWPDQPILFVSGYSETEAIRRIAPGAQLLAKPFRSDALDSAVRAALAGG